MTINVHNTTEDLVARQMELILPMTGGCTCEQCCCDIATHALNRLPQRYVATIKGALLSKLDTSELQFEANVVIAVTNAINIIGKHPSHELKPASTD